MRKIAIGNNASSTGGSSDSRKVWNSAWFVQHWRLITLFAIVLAAFLIRFVCAFGISAGDNYALSGGTSASSHLRIITEILAGTYDPANEAALNYPYGSASIYGPMFDYLMAGLAAIVGVFGISTTTAVSGVLAWSAPIFGALTCIPVYCIGKSLFKGDETIGLVSALFYATFAVLIMTTAFSNGTEYPFLCFIVALLIWALIRVFEATDRLGLNDPKSLFQNRETLRGILLAGLLFACVVLTWSGFWMFVVVAAVCLAITLVVRRIGGKDIAVSAFVVDTVLAIGIALGAVYYVTCGLWDAVFSGGCVLAILTIVYSLMFVAAEKKPWVVTIPVTAAIMIVVGVLIAVFVPTLSSAITGGNSYYDGSLMTALAEEFSRTTISSMAAYYGWVTIWMAMAFGAWMLYKYRKNGGSRLYGFTVLWLLSMFFVGWFSSNYAVVAGAAFSVGAAATLVTIFRAVDIKGYIKSLRGNGIKAGARKALNFFPFVTVIITALLVVVPNAVYAVDAATPTNDEGNDYYGGLGYTINTSDSSLVSSMWDYYSNVDKSGALLEWYGYANEATVNGGFDSVTSSNGGGTSALSAVLLSTSSEDAVVALMVRLLMADDSGLATALSGSGITSLTANDIAKYIDDPSLAVTFVQNNDDLSEYLTDDITDENAVYYTLKYIIGQSLTETEVCTLYDAVCDVTDTSINYIEVDASMLPVYYGDSSYLSSLTYFANGSLDSYGAAEQYYYYNTYTGYAYYNDALYDTFMWKALIGVTPSEYGYTSSISLLNALALSDGSVKAVPCYGLDNFSVSYWHVYYNADENATTSSSGWVDMDAYEAIALQNEQGGLINYLASVIVLEYDTDGDTTLSGTVEYDNGTGDEAASGVKVSVYERVDYDSSGATSYVLRSVDYTDASGNYSVSYPQSGDYYITFSSGSSSIRDGTVFATYGSASEVPSTVTMESTTIGGTIVTADDTLFEDFEGYIVLTGTTSGKTYQIDITDAMNGAYSLSGVMPDKYSAVLYSTGGTSLNTVSLTVAAGTASNLQISATTGTITVELTDEYGADAQDDIDVTLVETTYGYTFTGKISDGSVAVSVMPGTYSVSVNDDGYISVLDTTTTVAAKGSKTVSTTVYESATVTVTGGSGTVSLMAPGYTTTSGVVPSVGGIIADYTAYSVSGSTVYYGVGTDSITMTSAAGYKVSGIVKDTAGDATSATVMFIMNDGTNTYTFITSADSDGKYSMLLPAGTYTVYYNDGDDAFLKTVTVGTEAVAVDDVTLAEGREITANLVYSTFMSSPTTNGIAFVPVSAQLEYNGVTYTVYTLTNDDGEAVFVLPENCEVKLGLKAYDTAVFSITAQTTTVSSGTADDDDTKWKLNGTSTTDDDYAGYVKKTSVTIGYDAHLDAYKGSDYDVDLTSGVAADVTPGRYTCTINSNGYYFDGTVYIYPGASTFTVDVMYTMALTITSDDADDISVKSSDDEADYDSDGDVYYLEDGYDFTITVTDDDGKVFVYTVTAVGNTAQTLDVTSLTKVDTTTLSGYVGSNADGTVTVSFTSAYGGGTEYSATITGTITDGEYSVTVPSGLELTVYAEATATDDNDNTYTVKKTVIVAADRNVADSDTSDGVRCNFAAITDSVTLDGSDIVSGSNYTFADGNGQFDLTITNSGTYAQTYIVVGGDSFVLDKTYVVNVAAGSSTTVTIEGIYNALTAGAGNSDISVVVESLAGDEVATHVIPAGEFSVGSDDGNTTINVAGMTDASSDSVNGFAYKYAITVSNSNVFAECVYLTAASASLGVWEISFVDSTGCEVYGTSNVYTVNGYATATVYVMLINTTGDDSAVPSITVTATVKDGAGNGMTLSTSDESGNPLTISGSMASGTLEPASADLEQTGGSVSDGGSENDKKALSSVFWGLLIVTILLLFVFAYEAMKRGVFSRKR